MTDEQHDDLMREIHYLKVAIDLAIELLHDQHEWTAAAFTALGVEVAPMPPPPKGTVLRLVNNFVGHTTDGNK